MSGSHKMSGPHRLTLQSGSTGPTGRPHYPYKWTSRTPQAGPIGLTGGPHKQSLLVPQAAPTDGPESKDIFSDVEDQI